MYLSWEFCKISWKISEIFRYHCSEFRSGKLKARRIALLVIIVVLLLLFFFYPITWLDFDRDGILHYDSLNDIYSAESAASLRASFGFGYP